MGLEVVGLEVVGLEVVGLEVVGLVLEVIGSGIGTSEAVRTLITRQFRRHSAIMACGMAMTWKSDTLGVCTIHGQVISSSMDMCVCGDSCRYTHRSHSGQDDTGQLIRSLGESRGLHRLFCDFR